MISLPLQPRSDGVTLKDTFVNIRDTGEFVVNMVTLPLAHAMHRSPFEFDSDIDEFAAVDPEKAPSAAMRLPRVKDSPISLECKLNRIIPMGGVGDHLVFGEVLRFNIHHDVYLEGGRIDTGGLQAVGCLAAEYRLAHNAFTTPLEENVLASFLGNRAGRLDAHADGYSPIDTNEWSASGATR